MNVSHKLQEIVVSIYNNRLVSSPKQLSIAAMRAIESLSIYSVYVTHAARQIGIRSLDHEMIVLCEALSYVKLSFFISGLPFIFFLWLIFHWT